MVTWPPGSASGSASKYEETPDAPPDSGSTSQRKKKAGGRRVDIAELKLPTAPAVSWVENADSTPLEDTSVENNDQGPEQPLADAGGRRQSAPRIPSALSRGSMTSRAFGTAAESKREKPKPNVLRDLFSGAHIDWDYDNGGQRTQILKYDVPKLANWGFLLLWKGTAVSRYTILRALIMSGITTAIALHTCKRDSDNIETNNCIPISPETTWLQFSQLVSFLLGFFVTVTLNRWWATRERLQHVMGKSVTICMLFQSYAVIEDAETDRVRRHMLRWFNLAFRLVFKMADDDLEDYSDLKQLRLVTDEEEEALLEVARGLAPAPFRPRRSRAQTALCFPATRLRSPFLGFPPPSSASPPRSLPRPSPPAPAPADPAPRPVPPQTENPTAQVYTWISYALRKVGQSGRLLVGQSNCGAHMNGELIAMRNAVDEIMALVLLVLIGLGLRKVPYSYVHLLTVLTNLHLLFVLIYSSAAIGDGLNADPRNWERIFFGYVWMFFNQMDA
eukprot:tig00020675_g12669.t1